MADLAATDFTVTKVSQERMGRLKVNIFDLKFGDGAKTTPAAGVPLPAIGVFGFQKQIIQALVENTNGYVYVVDRANNKLKVYQADYDAVADGALVTSASLAPAEATVRLTLIGQ